MTVNKTHVHLCMKIYFTNYVIMCNAVNDILCYHIMYNDILLYACAIVTLD